MAEPDGPYMALLRRLRVEGGVDLRDQLHARYLELGRGAVTPGGLPYPDPADPVAEGADAIRALAEAVEAKPYVMAGAAGTATTAGAQLTLTAMRDPGQLLTGNEVTVRQAGVYRILARATQTGTAALSVQARINGVVDASYSDGRVGAAGAAASPILVADAILNPGDTVQFWVVAGSGSVTVTAASRVSLSFLNP